MSADEEMRMLLEEREKSERDLNSMIYEARQDGLAEGRLEVPPLWRLTVPAISDGITIVLSYINEQSYIQGSDMYA
jgi:hypothetical protein